MFKNKSVAILGLGKSGLSAYNFFKKNNYKVVAWDDKTEVNEKLIKEGFLIENFENWDFKNIDAIIVSPGISLYYPTHHPLVQFLTNNNLKTPLMCDIEVFLRFNKDNKYLKYIAITGTNGKSTTVSLLNFVLTQLGFNTILAGNIGNPILDYTPSLTHETFVVLELSSYQLELISSQNFLVSAVLNIKPDHLDHHGNFENYVNAKLNIFKNQGNGTLAIYSSQCEKLVKNVIKASKSIEVSDNFISIKEQDLLYLKGLHNQQNINFVYFICLFLGLNIDVVIDHINQFKGLTHRQEFVKKISEVFFINDSKATNLDSTAVALQTFVKDNIYLILGGVQKENSLDEILEQLKKVKHIFLIGVSTPVFAKILSQNNIAFSICSTLQDATTQAFKMARDTSNATILLSPACASFDMFKNFEDRGEQFKIIVNSLS
jgi:UDP-N-acetylmuramoylalanine--D-glutamate ligase